MKLRRFLQYMKPSDRKLLMSVLRSIARMNSTYERMLLNLEKESILEKEDWDDVTSRILKVQNNPSRAALVIQKYCQEGGKIRGKIIKLDPAVVFGRVKSFEAFCDFLRNEGYYTDTESARRAVRAKLGRKVDPNNVVWNEMDLAKFPMWATFNPESPSKPFGRSLPSVNRLLCSLGLEIDETPILIFQYLLPIDVLPRLPTFLDAYAIDPWPQSFRRVEDDAPYGLTEPPTSCVGIKGRPEIVHQRVKAKQLAAPLRLA